MIGERPAILAMAAMVVLALVAGIISVGGPMQGALEKRDDARFQDLMSLRNQIDCVRETDGALPETLEPTSDCDYGADSVDPITGEPYTYEVIDPETIRLCAGFEDNARIADRVEGYLGTFNDGCLTSQFTAS